MKQQSSNRLSDFKKSQNMHYVAKLGFGAFIVILSIFIFAPASVWSGSISEAFATDDRLVNGMIVSIVGDTPSRVELANLNNNRYLTGVAEDEDISLLSLQKDPTDVTVATYGEVEVYVSDINGDIKTGDFIGTSWLNGVGMRATDTTEQKVLGVALSDFSAENNRYETIEDIDTDDGLKSAQVGRIAVRILSQEVGPRTGNSSSDITTFVQQLAGRDVSVFRAVIATIVLISSLVVSGVFIVNSIRNSFISIGRNPLASSAIFSSLIQVSAVSVIVILIGAAISYALLVL